MPKRKVVIEHLDNGKYGYAKISMIIKDKHLIQATITSTPYGESLEDYIAALSKINDVYTDPTIELVDVSDYGDSYHVVQINFWREMTDAELKQADKLRLANKREAEEQAERQLEYERKQYEKLKQKFDG